MMKLQRQYFISVNKTSFLGKILSKNKERGQLFFFEILFVMLILLIFVFAYSHVKIESNAQDLLLNFKISDVTTIITAKQITDVNKIKDVINFYLPNTNYKIDINAQEEFSNIDKENKCIAKDINVYGANISDANIWFLKNTNVKIIFCN